MIAESGLPGFDYNLWIGLFAPSATPPDIVDKINRDVTRVLQTSAPRERLAALGAEAMPMTPPEFHKFVAAEIEE
jgi:tripartite-type tricarboxylate transporter receptor subunit TctC